MIDSHKNNHPEYLHSAIKKNRTSISINSPFVFSTIPLSLSLFRPTTRVVLQFFFFFPSLSSPRVYVASARKLQSAFFLCTRARANSHVYKHGDGKKKESRLYVLGLRCLSLYRSLSILPFYCTRFSSSFFSSFFFTFGFPRDDL